MKNETKQALLKQSTWVRLPVIALFLVLLAIMMPVVMAVSLVGWIGRLVYGQTSEAVVAFGTNVGCWFEQAIVYVTSEAERRPFPFEDMDCPSDRSMVAGPVGRSRSSVVEPAAASVKAPPYSGDQAKPAGAAEPEAGLSKKTSRKAKSRTSKQATKKANGKKIAASKKVTKKKMTNKKVTKKTGKKPSARNKTGARKTDSRTASSDRQSSATGPEQSGPSSDS